MLIIVPIVLVFTSSILTNVHCCSIPRGWKIKSLAERAKSAEIVFYGKVLRSPTKWHYPSPESAPILKIESGLYTAEVGIYCIFKGDLVQRWVLIFSVDMSFYIVGNLYSFQTSIYLSQVDKVDGVMCLNSFFNPEILILNYLTHNFDNCQEQVVFNAIPFLCVFFPVILL